MLTVSEAQALILEKMSRGPAGIVELNHFALGLVLAEQIISDLDVPPFDKAMMDGYAVRAADFVDGTATLAIVGELMAGQTTDVKLGNNEAIRIMTGAPVQGNADAVVMIERTQMLANGKVRCTDPTLHVGLNVLTRGREMRAGEVILNEGTLLGPQELGILATVGRTQAQVYARPNVAILSTGDEVIDPPGRPGPGQIRNSNAPTLAAQVHRAGAVPHYLGIARDRLDSLKPLIEKGLQHDFLILSGGVSAGKVDLVPQALEELGVEAHFHKVAMKPGKPVLFGSIKDTLVFALPGNPVSALVCFELFVRPALRKRMGWKSPLPPFVAAPLALDFEHAGERPTYHPAVLEETDQGRGIRLAKWFGSADLRGLSQTNALAIFPSGICHYKQGDMIKVMPIHS